MLLKCCNQICQQIWKTQQWSQERKKPVFLKKPNAKECSNCYKIIFISRARKVIFKALQEKFLQYGTEDFQMCKLDLRKGRGARDQINNIG